MKPKPSMEINSRMPHPLDDFIVATKGYDKRKEAQKEFGSGYIPGTDKLYYAVHKNKWYVLQKMVD